MAVNWQALAREVVAARVALGYQTREAFAKAVGLSTRTLGDIERARRTSMDRATLAKVEQTLEWPTGRVDEILHQPQSQFVSVEGPVPGTYIVGPPDAMAAVGGRPVPLIVHTPPGTGADELVEPSEMGPPEPSTPEGIARYIHRDDLPLVALLHRAGLNETDLFKLILHVRAARERQNADLLADVADRIRDVGGWAPNVVWPPLWLADDGEESNDGGAKSNNGP